ncbi:MAG: hypothetical protein Q9168_007881 [Polycauliona sp. 1 TL-2023]
MSSDHVLRISRSDLPGEYVLLNSSSNGSSPLDLQILATEGTEPYRKACKAYYTSVGIIAMFKLTDRSPVKHARISKYRAKSNHLSESQWEKLLRSTLLQDYSPDQEEPDLTQLEIVASIANSKLTMTFRKSISGIHQKLGEFSLSKDPDAGINVLDWANTAVLRAENLEIEARAIRQKLVEQTGLAQKLNQQLEHLIQSKKEHENALLEKCALLINEKKAKIRDQQRLLATAKVDPTKLRALQATRRPNSPSRQDSGPSTKGKRKASALASSVDDEEDGVEDHRIKAEDIEEQQPDSEDVTPEHSDLDETEDEVENAELKSVPVASGGKGKAIEKPEVGGREDLNGVMNSAPDVDLPPRRELPFSRQKSGPSQPTDDMNKDQDTNMADDDETDDDEL